MADEGVNRPAGICRPSAPAPWATGTGPIRGIWSRVVGDQVTICERGVGASSFRDGVGIDDFAYAIFTGAGIGSLVITSRRG